MHFLHLILTLYLIISKNSVSLSNLVNEENSQCSIESKNDCQSNENIPQATEKYKKGKNSIYKLTKKAFLNFLIIFRNKFNITTNKQSQTKLHSMHHHTR